MGYFSRISRLRRKEASLQRKVEYHFNQRREWAYKAYAVDMMQNPRMWGELQTNANWHGHWYHLAYRQLDKVQEEIKELENQK